MGKREKQPFSFTGREADFLVIREAKTRLYYSTETREGSATPQRTGGGRIEMSTPVTEDLYFYRARHYDPYAGRFLTKDPIGFLGGDVNRYRYVVNNPVSFIDPFGAWRAPGHRRLTINSMSSTYAFTSSDIDSAVRSNLNVDIPRNQFNNAAHYMPGYREEAEALINNLLERAILAELSGNRDAAMYYLGEGLHTVQDRWSHYEQNAGWWEHIRGARCDDPIWRPREFAAAEDSSKRYIEQFLKRTGKRNILGEW